MNSPAVTGLTLESGSLVTSSGRCEKLQQQTFFLNTFYLCIYTFIHHVLTDLTKLLSSPDLPKHFLCQCLTNITSRGDASKHEIR